jgi:glucosamine-6-phosphate deaminase
MDYKISQEDLFAWCSIPRDELANQKNLKMKLLMEKDRSSIMEVVGNMMADEIIKNNYAGKITRWVLPAGPMDEYDTFIARVNREKISLKNLYVFHMDEFLDWEGRPFPVADTYESLEGTMNAGFYARIDEELNVPLEQRFWPRINDIDAVDKKVEELGGVDTMWAGVGCKGLIAFCEAPRSYVHRISMEQYKNSKTRIVELNDDTVVALSERTFGGLYDRIPPKSITLGFKTMLSAKRAVLMVTTGSWKQTALRVALFSEPTLEYPVTLLPESIPEVIMACDENTADHPMSHTIRGW